MFKIETSSDLKAENTSEVLQQKVIYENWKAKVASQLDWFNFFVILKNIKLSKVYFIFKNNAPIIFMKECQKKFLHMEHSVNILKPVFSFKFI